MKDNFTDIHPDELIFRDFMTELEQLLIKCEGQYLDEKIISHLKKVRLQVFEIQGGRASAFVKKIVTLKNHRIMKKTFSENLVR